MFRIMEENFKKQEMKKIGRFWARLESGDELPFLSDLARLSK